MSTRIYCDQCGAGTSKREALRFSLSGYSTNHTSMGRLNDIEIERLALALWEHNGERPNVYEIGKRIADRELEWWKQVAVSAWSFINGTEKEQ